MYAIVSTARFGAMMHIIRIDKTTPEAVTWRQFGCSTALTQSCIITRNKSAENIRERIDREGTKYGSPMCEPCSSSLDRVIKSNYVVFDEVNRTELYRTSDREIGLNVMRAMQRLRELDGFRQTDDDTMGRWGIVLNTFNSEGDAQISAS